MFEYDIGRRDSPPLVIIDHTKPVDCLIKVDRRVGGATVKRFFRLAFLSRTKAGGAPNGIEITVFFHIHHLRDKNIDIAQGMQEINHRDKKFYRDKGDKTLTVSLGWI